MEQWKNNQKKIALHDQTISYIDTEIGEEVLLILHGFATSSYDYHKILDDLKKSYRVIIPDLIGFGFSSKPKHFFYTAKDQASLLTALLQELEINNISIMAQGFGVNIYDEIMTILELGFVKINVNEVFFINSKLELSFAKNAKNLEVCKQKLAAILVKQSLSFEMFKKYFKATFHKREALNDAEIENYWNILNYNNGLKSMNFIDNYILESIKYSETRLQNMSNSKTNTYVIGSKSDYTEFIECSHKLENVLELNAENVAIIDDCGYFPMLEKPKEFAKIIENFKETA